MSKIIGTIGRGCKMQKIILIFIILALASKAGAFNIYVERECKRYKIPTWLVYNLIKAESDGKSYLEGPKIRIKVNGKYIVTKAVGLMQVVAEYHYKLNRNDLFNPVINIKVGCRILNDCIKRANGNYIVALKNYNSGPYSNYYNWKYINQILKNNPIKVKKIYS
jgi:soluble lytic murein transglycosylase-like protein